MRVPTTLLLVLVAILAKASAAEDLYWEGEDDLANEFLEVDRDSGIGGHLRRLKRAWFWDTPTTAAPEPEENFTEDDEPIEDDDNLNGGSGAREPELEPELKEKTLRVTFVVMEPYRVKYSNRDSPQFQNFSKSLAEAVNTVFRDLPGTHRASLVRIQSRPADEFSCKVTLDIVVTGDDTNRVSETLRDYIRIKRKLGNITVYDEDYSATVLHTGFVDSETIDQNENHYNEVERGDSNPDATILPDIVTPDNDNIFGENPIGVDESETTEEINPYEGGNEETPFFGRPDEQGPDDLSPSEGSPDERRNEIERPEGSPDDGRNDYGRPEGSTDEGRNDFGRPEASPDERRNDYERPEGSPDEGRNDYGRPDYDRPTERPDDRNQGQDFPHTELPETTRSYSCPDDAMSCDDTRCVPLNLRCDGRRDCDDGADELGCPDKDMFYRPQTYG